MEALGKWAERHKWAYPIVWPILIVGVILKIPQALKEWGES